MRAPTARLGLVGMSDTGQSSHSPPVGLTAHPKRLPESSDSYPYVIARLNDRWRVVVCNDAIQWILQRRHQSGPLGWRGRSYCTTREGLLCFVGEHVGRDAVALVKALSLPDWIQKP